MKRHQTLTILTIFIYSLIFSQCTDTCDSVSSYTYYQPVFTPLEELRGMVGYSAPRKIEQSGKIYYINDHLLINKPNEGIHIVDNGDPKNPQNIGFIQIPGSFDLAAVGQYLYVDSYVDLVVLDISDLSNPHEVKRLKNLFPNYNSWGYYLSEEGIVTDWIEVEETNEMNIDCDEVQNQFSWGFHHESGIAVKSFSSNSVRSPSTNVSSQGVGGSMARFTINADHLFMIDQSEMHIANISNPVAPILGAKVQVGWGIETIFPYEDMIFIGANNGMYIYDVSSPLRPELLSNYRHMNSCDPVVTDGKYAYVTLRSGNLCQGFTNQLEVIDIQDPRNPELVETYPMYNPHGLSKSGDHLFICDGQAGLKVYDASNVNAIDQNLIKAYTDIHAYDVIVIDCIVMLIGDDGLHQYQCNDFQSDLTYLSSIVF